MNTTATIPFQLLDLDQLAAITGGFDWGDLGRSMIGGGIAGAAGGAVGGAITGPGALLGAAGGAAGGAVGYGVYNAGQQLGYWK